PSATHRATSASQSSPASAVTTTRSPSAETATPRLRTRTTSPANPSSATTRLLPPPSTSTGSPSRPAPATSPKSPPAAPAPAHAPGRHGHAPAAHADDQPGEPLVGHDEVAPAAEHQHRLAVPVGAGDQPDELLGRAGLRERPGRAAHPQRRVRREPYPCQPVGHASPRRSSRGTGRLGGPGRSG